MLAVFFGGPMIVAAMVDPKHRFERVFDLVGLGRFFDGSVPLLVFPILALTTGGFLVVLALSRTFDYRQLWNARAAAGQMKRMLAVWLFFVVLLSAYAYVMATWTELLPPEAFFGLPRNQPGLWLAIMVLYPVVSAYPQEITHRAFFFHRYGALVRRRWVIVLINAAAFSAFHLAFWNVFALGLTFVGGVLFAQTYLRSRSTLAAAIEHALYGNLLFTTGLGWFVYAGSVGS